MKKNFRLFVLLFSILLLLVHILFKSGWGGDSSLAHLLRQAPGNGGLLLLVLLGIGEFLELFSLSNRGKKQLRA
ncbi:hypothetical protein V9K67_21465 [Paraflavisolibacter sp. H34]|uniref:hypothetical protein n=1 Tax=Huijunlia imazamoxiresistens TaxID=3127457 RepID=UPI00301948D5